MGAAAYLTFSVILQFIFLASNIPANGHYLSIITPITQYFLFLKGFSLSNYPYLDFYLKGNDYRLIANFLLKKQEFLQEKLYLILNVSAVRMMKHFLRIRNFIIKIWFILQNFDYSG